MSFFGRLGSEEMKFLIDVSVIRVETTSCSDPIAVRFTRGGKAVQTPAFNGRAGNYDLNGSAPLSLSATLYRKRDKYLPKEAEISVLLMKGHEKTFGRAMIDIARYVDLAEQNSTEVLPLEKCSDRRAKVTIKIHSKLISATAASPQAQSGQEHSENAANGESKTKDGEDDPQNLDDFIGDEEHEEEPIEEEEEEVEEDDQDNIDHHRRPQQNQRRQPQPPRQQHLQQATRRGPQPQSLPQVQQQRKLPVTTNKQANQQQQQQRRQPQSRYPTTTVKGRQPPSPPEEEESEEYHDEEEDEQQLDEDQEDEDEHEPAVPIAVPVARTIRGAPPTRPQPSVQPASVRPDRAQQQGNNPRPAARRPPQAASESEEEREEPADDSRADDEDEVLDDDEQVEEDQDIEEDEDARRVKFGSTETRGSQSKPKSPHHSTQEPTRSNLKSQQNNVPTSSEKGPNIQAGPLAVITTSGPSTPPITSSASSTPRSSVLTEVQAVKPIRPSAIFNCSLPEAMTLNPRGYKQDVPFIFDTLLTALEKNNGLSTEGLFRVTPDKKTRDLLKNQLEEGNYKISPTTDPITIAAIVTHWLLCVGTKLPIIPIPLHAACLEIGKIELEPDDEQDRDSDQEDNSSEVPHQHHAEIHTKIVQVVSQFPVLTQRLLIRLIGFLLKVSNPPYVDSNKMNIHALSVVFAPSVITLQVEELPRSKYAVTFLEHLIHHNSALEEVSSSNKADVANIMTSNNALPPTSVRQNSLTRSAANPTSVVKAPPTITASTTAVQPSATAATHKQDNKPSISQSQRRENEEEEDVEEVSSDEEVLQGDSKQQPIKRIAVAASAISRGAAIGAVSKAPQIPSSATKTQPPTTKAAPKDQHEEEDEEEDEEEEEDVRQPQQKPADIKEQRPTTKEETKQATQPAPPPPSIHRTPSKVTAAAPPPPRPPQPSQTQTQTQTDNIKPPSSTNIPAAAISASITPSAPTALTPQSTPSKEKGSSKSPRHRGSRPGSSPRRPPVNIFDDDEDDVEEKKGIGKHVESEHDDDAGPSKLSIHADDGRQEQLQQRQSQKPQPSQTDRGRAPVASPSPAPLTVTPTAASPTAPVATRAVSVSQATPTKQVESMVSKYEQQLQEFRDREAKRQAEDERRIAASQEKENNEKATEREREIERLKLIKSEKEARQEVENLKKQLESTTITLNKKNQDLLDISKKTKAAEGKDVEMKAKDQQINDLNAQIALLNTEIKAWKDKVAADEEREEELASLQEQIQQLHDEMNKKDELIHKQEVQIDQVRKVLKDSENKIAQLIAAASATAPAVEMDEGDDDEFEIYEDDSDEVVELKQRMIQLKKMLRRRNEELRKLKKASGATSTTSAVIASSSSPDLSEYQRLLRSSESKVNNQQQQIDSLQAKLLQQQQQLALQQSQLQDTASQLKQKDLHITELIQELKEHETNASQANINNHDEQEIEHLKEQVAEYQRQLEEQRHQLDTLNETVNNQNAQLEELMEAKMNAELAGNNQADEDNNNDSNIAGTAPMTEAQLKKMTEKEKLRTILTLQAAVRNTSRQQQQKQQTIDKLNQEMTRMKELYQQKLKQMNSTSATNTAAITISGSSASAVSEKQITSLQQQLKGKDDRIAEFESKLVEYELTVSKLQEEAEKMRQLQTTVGTKVSSMEQKEAQWENAMKQMEDIKQQLNQAQTEKAALQEKCKQLETNTRSLQEETSRVEKELEKAKTSRRGGSGSGSLNAAEISSVTAQRELIAIKEELDALKIRYEASRLDSREKIEAEKKQKQSLREQLVAEQHEIDLLRQRHLSFDELQAELKTNINTNQPQAQQHHGILHAINPAVLLKRGGDKDHVHLVSALQAAQKQISHLEQQVRQSDSMLKTAKESWAASTAIMEQEIHRLEQDLQLHQELLETAKQGKPIEMESLALLKKKLQQAQRLKDQYKQSIEKQLEIIRDKEQEIHSLQEEKKGLLNDIELLKEDLIKQGIALKTIADDNFELKEWLRVSIS